MTATMTALTLAVDALILASLADVVTTRAGIRSGHLYERNPLMRWATRTTARALGVKAAGLLVVGAQLFFLADTAPNVALGVTWAAALFTLRLAWNNYRLLRAVQRG